MQRKPVDLTKETDRKKKDKRNQRRRELRKNKKTNKAELKIAAMDFVQKITQGKLGIQRRQVSTVRASLLPELFQLNMVLYLLWKLPYPRGTSVQNRTPVTGVKSSSLNTKN